MPPASASKLSRNAFASFLAVVETGSIRRAAEILGLAQSAISRQIMAIEDELQVKLLNRLPNGIAVTAAGEIFARHAYENKAQLERIRAEISSLRGLRNAAVRVAIVETFASQVLPACVSAFRARHPDVTYHAYVGVTASVVKAVRDGLADFGIAYNPSDERDLKIRSTLRDPTVAVMKPTHALATRPELSLAELTGTDVALPGEGSPIRAEINTAARSMGLTLRPALETNAMPMLLALATLADVVAVVPQIAATDALRDGTLLAVPLREKIFAARHITIFSVAGWPLTAAAETFARFVEQHLQRRRPPVA